MRSSISHLILAGLALISLLVLTYAVNTPILFSLENRTGTLNHRDLQHETTITQANSSSVLSLMDELLQNTATITIRISARDLESAKEQIREALADTEHLEHVVIDLDLEGSDINEFAQENRKTLQELYEIVNESGRFEELRSVEVHQTDPSSNQTRSIVYEGEALNQTIHERVNTTRSREDRIAAIGEAYGLNTTAYRRSTSSLQNFTASITEEQENLVTSESPLAPSTISIGIAPARGTYNETLAVAGTVSGRPGGGNATLEVILDSRSAGTAEVDPSGNYRYLLPIRRIASGTHFVYVVTGSALSDIEQFEVFPLDTSLTLTVTPSAGIGTTGASCSGALFTADRRPVADATVSLTIDGRAGTETVTNADGSYLYHANLTPGTHTITAAFSDEGLPLNRSRSMPTTINIVPGPGPLMSLLAVAIVGITSIISGNWYLRRSRNTVPLPKKPLQIAEAYPESTEPAESKPGVADMDLHALAAALLSTGEPREGVALLYHALLDWLEVTPRIHLIRTMTPRELLDYYRNRQFASCLADFVELHERICYAGQTPDSGERERFIGLFVGILAPTPGDANE